MLPKPKLKQLLGINTNIEKLNEFLYDFQNKTLGYRKACVLHGHQGTGKTSLVHAIAEEYGFPLIEINGSETNTKDALISAIAPIISTIPIEYSRDKVTKNRIILIDEADGLDRNAIKFLPEIFKLSLHPIILTANNFYPLSLLKNHVLELKFNKHKSTTITNVLKQYTNNEEHIIKITENCNGDIRAALNMLNSHITKIYSEHDKYFVIDSLLNGKEVDGTFSIENRELISWLDENIRYRSIGISFLQNYENLCNAARLERKSQKYTELLLTENTRLLSMFHINEWIKTLPPSYFEKMKIFNNRNNIIKMLANKLPTHTYKRFESDVLPLLQKHAKDESWLKEIYQIYLYDMDEDGKPTNEVIGMVALLLNVPSDDIAVKGFFDSMKDKKIPIQQNIETQYTMSRNPIIVNSVDI